MTTWSHYGGLLPGNNVKAEFVSLQYKVFRVLKCRKVCDNVWEGYSLLSCLHLVLL